MWIFDISQSKKRFVRHFKRFLPKSNNRYVLEDGAAKVGFIVNWF